jgi:hypothetical protein
MKLRLTPLNFATAFLIVLAFVTWFYKPVSVTGNELKQWTGTIAIIFLTFAVFSFFLDMLFRNYFLQTKMLWMVEIAFIILTAVIYLLVR